MAMNIKDIESLIKKKIPDAKVVIKDLVGDNNHFSAEIASKEFNGKTRLEQHKMVYNSLSEELKDGIKVIIVKTFLLKKATDDLNYHLLDQVRKETEKNV